MHNWSSSQILGYSFGCLFLLEAAAQTVLFLADRDSWLIRIGTTLHGFSSKELLAFPGAVAVDLWMPKMSFLPWQPLLFAMGAAACWVFFELWAALDHAA
jgi:hypothetical protein